ncbi:22390_t:CDS:2 [Dentiscutata erythropus]|uniref:22390_t:CDS:1 n=1 Tax=Dentiscutata erythropus TaxID=1348616 RepID=A0A9N8ZUY2_9GLOM|nr:22390_t:CDS:2 [Dentiscutata erythropus]
MSVSVNSDPAVFSRLQLAKALKEDSENSAIFVHNRPKQDDYDNITQQPQQSPHPQRKRASSYTSPSLNENPRDSMVAPEERRGSLNSLGKPTTLMDVRQTILNTRQNHMVSSFSPSSSHRTSLILQQPKSLPDVHVAKTHSKSNNLSNSRPSSVHNNAPLRSNPTANNSSRPSSSYVNIQSRPNSVATNQSRPSSSYTNSPSRPSSLDESSDDVPLALKIKPVIKVASPNGPTKKNGERIEEWLNNVSSDDGFLNPDPTYNVRGHRLSDYTPNQTFSASPLGRGSIDHRRHRSSTFDSHPQKSLSPQNFRRKSHTDLSPHRKNDLLSSPQLVTGRISPNQRQDSGNWARETLAALSSDARHQMLMNDSSSGTTTSTSSSANIAPRERKNSSSSLNIAYHRERKDSASSLNIVYRERKDSATSLNKTRHNRNQSSSSYGSLHSPHSPYSPKMSSGHFPPQSPQPYVKSKHRDSLHPHSSINMNYGHIPTSEGGRNNHGHYTSESNRRASSDRGNPGTKSKSSSGSNPQKYRVR